MLAYKIIDALEELAPKSLAEDWDNVGLLVGSSEQKVTKVMLALEIRDEIIDEAIKNNVNMIVTHHPLIFKPMKKIVADDMMGAMVIKLIKNNISLYAAHTNLDTAWGGTSDYLAELLNIPNTKPLAITNTRNYYKVIVYVPNANLETLKDAMVKAGGGTLGDYEGCSFHSYGTGGFKPVKGANPHVGTIGEYERVEEIKLEMMVADDKLSSVVKAVNEIHPYECPAYDIIKLENKIEDVGLGRVGNLDKPLKLWELAGELKHKLDADSIKVVGDMDREIKKVAICTGAGSDFIFNAFKHGCDCYITGDVKYHEAQMAKDLGITLIDAGHYETEVIICEKLKDYLSSRFETELELIISEENINPFTTLA